MKIIISKYAGYCMGVKRAFLRSFKAAENHSDLRIYGEMVHNRFALKSLEEKGIILVKNLDQILSDDKIKCVIVRAHGIHPEEEKKLQKSGKTVFDFTCPKVKQVQLLAQKLSDESHTIILFGKATHPEVMGITGYCRNPYYIIKNIEEIDSIPPDTDNPALLSQTTMNSDTFLAVCEKLKGKFGDIKIFTSLCSLPVRIQENAVNLAKQVDAMIVVGDKMSANTATLFEKIRKISSAFFVETIDDIDVNEIKKYKRIGITGGSSTPDWQMTEIRKYLENINC